MTIQEIEAINGIYDPVIRIIDETKKVGSTRINTWMGTTEQVNKILSRYKGLQYDSCLIDGATVILINE